MASQIIITARAQLEVAVNAAEQCATNPTKANKECAKNLAHEFVRVYGRRTLETLKELQKELK